MASIETESDALREIAYNIETPSEEFLAVIRGLSRKIRLKSIEVRKLRASLVVGVH